MNPTPPTLDEALSSFFESLPRAESVLRVVTSDTDCPALFRFTGEKNWNLLLDFGQRPMQVRTGVRDDDGRVTIKIDTQTMHRIFSGDVAPGLCFGRREMLLKGSPSDFARLIPLFDFAPVLYRDHLAAIGFDGRPQPKNQETAPMPNAIQKHDPRSEFEKFFQAILHALAYWLGFALGWIRHHVFKNLRLFDVLASLSQGLEDAAPKEKKKDSSGWNNPR